MEAVRPEVDAYVLDWITREPLKREWFFEQRDGTCRLMSSLAIRLGETAPMWARAVAPVAEWVARQLWSRQRKPSHETAPPTRLTQRHKREVKRAPSLPQTERAAQFQTLCRGCGKDIEPRSTHCAQCAVSVATERLAEAARAGRVAGHTPEALSKQGNTQRRHRQAQTSWSSSMQPEWLTENAYAESIQPLLATLSSSTIASRLGISRWYAGRIRQGYRPHPRHWQALATLVGITSQV
jgi:hypothetical protein